MFNIRSALLSIMLLAFSSAGDRQNDLLVRRQAASGGCMIIDVMFEAGDTPCGLGLVIYGCQCCYGQFPCNSLTQTCGTVGCVDLPQFYGGCVAGEKLCGNACIAASDVCCSGTGFCQAGYLCDQASDQCIPESTGPATVSHSGLPATTASSSVGKVGSATVSSSGLPGTIASSSNGQGLSQATARSAGKPAFGWEATAWRLLALEAVLLSVT
jgi:hypothetical protein